MYQNCCKKCGSVSLHTEQKGNNVGLYCDDCGAWIKWLGKDELRAFEHSIKESSMNDISETSDKKDVITRLKEFVKRLEEEIDKEMRIRPLSPEDAIRKSAYCMALEKDKNAISSILNDKDYWEY